MEFKIVKFAGGQPTVKDLLHALERHRRLFLYFGVFDNGSEAVSADKAWPNRHDQWKKTHLGFEAFLRKNKRLLDEFARDVACTKEGKTDAPYNWSFPPASYDILNSSAREVDRVAGKVYEGSRNGTILACSCREAAFSASGQWADNVFWKRNVFCEVDPSHLGRLDEVIARVRLERRAAQAGKPNRQQGQHDAGPVEFDVSDDDAQATPKRRCRRPAQIKHPRLTRKENAVLEILDALPSKDGIMGPEIIGELQNLTPAIRISQGTLTGRVIPGLKKKGYLICNMPGVGYFLDR